MILLSSFYTILYIVMAIFGILALGGLTGKEREERSEPLDWNEVKIKYYDMPDPPVSDVFNTYVGGAKFYNSRSDLRAFAGFVYFDPEEDAPRIYRNDLKMLGHIPRERVQEYERWSNGEVYPCVGYVLRGADIESLNTELRIIKPFNRRFVEQEIRRYVGWVVMSHGIEANIQPEKYVPLLSEQEIQQLKQQTKKQDK